MADARRSRAYSPEMRDNLEFSGFLQKRRGGFGKYAIAGAAWQERFVTVTKQGLLTYYEGDPYEFHGEEQKEKPRGRIDLRSVNYEFLKDLRSEGAPTIWCMQICPPNEEKWVLCASKQEDYQRWCIVLEKFVQEKVVFIPGTNGMSPINYASDDDGYRSNASFRSGTSTPEAQSRSKSTSDPNCPSASVLSNVVRRASFRSPSASGENLLSKGSAAAALNYNSSSSLLKTAVQTGSKTNNSNTNSNSTGGKQKKRIKAAVSNSTYYFWDALEWTSTLVIMNFSFYMSVQPSTSFFMFCFYIAVGNIVVGRTLILRNERIPESVASILNEKDTGKEKLKQSEKDVTGLSSSGVGVGVGVDSVSAQKKMMLAKAYVAVEEEEHFTDAASVRGSAVAVPAANPNAGDTFKNSLTTQRNSPEHTWCKADYRQFQVRMMDYSTHKKKSPSTAPLFEAFAVDVFCTKKRIDNATQRFTLPDTSHINTHNAHVPAIFVIQIQIPADPPPSIFTTVEDGPGWAILMYYRVTEDTCNQLKNLSTASPAVKLFAQWCEKAPIDPLWRGRFKVINSCTNLEELGMPQAITSYNAKPVLIRRTGTIFKGPNYLEMDIHVHKFANIAKRSIHLITSRCSSMAMQIGFVIEGREDHELPETLFACVAVNKPQEDSAEFLFDDDED